MCRGIGGWQDGVCETICRWSCLWGSCHTDRRFALEGLVVNAVCALWRAVMLPSVRALQELPSRCICVVMSARCAGGVAFIGGLFFKVCAVMSMHVLPAVYTDGAYYCWSVLAPVNSWQTRERIRSRKPESGREREQGSARGCGRSQWRYARMKSDWARGTCREGSARGVR